MWRTNNAGEIELDEEHEEGWGRQKKRDRKSKERKLEGKQSAVENGWWINHKCNINHRIEEDNVSETDAQEKKEYMLFQLPTNISIQPPHGSRGMKEATGLSWAILYKT